MNKLAFWFILVLQCSSFIESAQILYLLGVPSKSHFEWNQAIINRLAKSQQNHITVVSFETDLVPPDNVQYVHLEFSTEDEMSKKEIFNTYQKGAFSATLSFYKFSYLACREALSSKSFKNLWRQATHHRFDLIIYDFTSGPCLLSLLYKFGTHTPLISVSAFNNPQFTTDIVPYKKNLAVSPHFATSYGLEMNFFQRLHNCAIHTFDYLYRNYIFRSRINSMVRLHLSSDIPDLNSIERRSLLVLLNQNPGVDFTELVPPNIISVGGLHVNDPDILPMKLEEFIATSKKGTVVMWLGANYGSSVMPEDKQRMFIDAFKSLPDYHFIWKFDTDNIEGYSSLPKNVRIRPRLTMNDVLAHPKVVGFITHCGLLSIHEATINGVPLIAVPLFPHHHRNWYQLHQAGVGRKLALDELDYIDIRDTINFVVNNPKFRKNMRARSKHFTEQTQKPLDKAIWWIEWAIRNPDSSFMNPPVFDYFRGNSLDVFFFVAFTSAIVIALDIRCLFIAWKLIRARNPYFQVQVQEEVHAKKKY